MSKEKPAFRGEAIYETTSDDPNGFAVLLLGLEVGGKTYAAGKVYGRVDNGPVVIAVAVACNEEKHVTLPALAPAWLTAQGLPYEAASTLVADALGMPDCEIITRDRPADLPPGWEESC